MKSTNYIISIEDLEILIQNSNQVGLIDSYIDYELCTKANEIAEKIEYLRKQQEINNG